MKVLAITKTGNEFLYKASTARAVSERSAATVRDIVNKYGYKLESGQTWHVYDIDKYDAAFIYASCQRFTIRKGIVKDCRF